MLGKTLLAFVLLHFVLQGQICLLLHVSLGLYVTQTRKRGPRQPTPGNKGFVRTLVIQNEIDNHSESRDINKKGINDTDKYIYRSSPQLEACKDPDASLPSILFIDQRLNVTNSWLAN